MKVAAHIGPNNEMQRWIFKQKWMGTTCTLSPHIQIDKLKLIEHKMKGQYITQGEVCFKQYCPANWSPPLDGFTEHCYLELIGMYYTTRTKTLISLGALYYSRWVCKGNFLNMELIPEAILSPPGQYEQDRLVNWEAQ